MSGPSTDFGNPWWTKPFVGDAYSVVHEIHDASGVHQIISAIPYRTHPTYDSKWYSFYAKRRVCYIIKWRWK